MEQFYAYLAVTIGSIVLTVGIFVGTTRTMFGNVKEIMTMIQLQLSELKEEQKSMNELNTRMSVAEQAIVYIGKCQDHLQSDMTILKKRGVKKGEE